MSHASRDRLVVRTLRCGRSNPGSNPGHGMPRKIFFEHPVNCCVFSILLCQNNRRFEITKKNLSVAHDPFKVMLLGRKYE